MGSHCDKDAHQVQEEKKRSRWEHQQRVTKYKKVPKEVMEPKKTMTILKI